MTQEGYGRKLFGIAESFPGFSMAIILDCSYSVGILFSMKQLFSVVSSHLWALRSSFFIIITTSGFVVLHYCHSFPVQLLLPGVVQDASARMAPLLLNRNWCATWFALTRHGRLDVVGPLDSFLIIFHALRLL